MRTGYTQLIFEMNKEIEKIKSNAMKQITEEQNRVLAQAEKDFARLGWKRWIYVNLRTDEQFRRLKESAEDTELELIELNEETKSGIAADKARYMVSGNKCSCADFVSNDLPCKHMYFLAGLLTNKLAERESVRDGREKDLFS